MAQPLLQEVPKPATALDTIAPAVERLRAAFDRGHTRPLEWRKQQLQRVLDMVEARGQDLVEAIQADFGKPELEAWTTDVGQASSEASAALKKLDRWVRPERVGLPIPGMGRSEIHHDPLGVVLIISPWNYPVGLLLSPLVGAIAAGNAAVLKPSEVTPHTSRALASAVAEFLDPEAIALVEGGVEETQALLELRFDHIMYTGNGAVGRIVMEAAARHLTPVTLELGGKSPCIVDATADLEVTARRIAWGKFINCGQTCIAPDYVLAEPAVAAELAERIGRCVKDFYGDDPKASPDYARIVNERHCARVAKLIEGEDAAFGGQVDPSDRYIAPTLLRDVSPDAPVMGEEVFGPVLPVVQVADLDEAIAFVNDRDKPLALYLFSNDRARQDRVLAETSSGGACINGTILHIANAKLPFGGVGPSGMGAYHGRHTFETFSHRKSVLRRGFRFDLKLMYPPYSARKTSMAKKLF